MAKNLKLNIKNTQIAQAINLGGIKSKLAKKKQLTTEELPDWKSVRQRSGEKAHGRAQRGAPRIKARSKSAFAETHLTEVHHVEASEVDATSPVDMGVAEAPPADEPSVEGAELVSESPSHEEVIGASAPTPVETKPAEISEPKVEAPPKERLGPTGRHIKDILPAKPAPRPALADAKRVPVAPKTEAAKEAEAAKLKPKGKAKADGSAPAGDQETADEKAKKGVKGKFKEFRDLKPARKQESVRFDARDRQGLRVSEDEQEWRKRRSKARSFQEEAATVRPITLKVRLPIVIKDLAAEMKLKASELIAKLFLQGVMVTLNDVLEDETVVQLLGQEFGCEISIDTTEAERIRITDKTVKEELAESDLVKLIVRPPVVAFMGHVDHGKTSLIDAIRKSNRVAGEAGAITQHIGAFRCTTPVGDITILDTPGHEAFSSMRARGADITDIVVLVVAGDEGIRQQTIEAIQHAKAAKVTIVVALNKADKPNFNPDTVYRQLADQELLPETWGGQTITVNCSAVTGQGVPQLLEMLALQAEVLELKANPSSRARGRVIESEMHKGMGASATVLVQNGTLRPGDSVVFEHFFGRVKTMHDENGFSLTEAGPSTPVEITGLSGLPAAGQEFIVVKNEKEAREISEARLLGQRQTTLQKKKVSMDNLLLQASETSKKMLNIVLRADVQGSLEALKVALLKISSEKADLNIIFTGVGEITESDIQLAAASKAVVIGFHTQVEGHADTLAKELGVQVRTHDIIYHAIDDVKLLMTGMLDKIPQETDKGKALVKATFKSSQVGIIAGCQVIEGTISRGNILRLKREDKEVWRGNMSSLKRVKEDVREVQKGIECGILLSNFSDVQEGDILEAFEITYLTQEL